MVCDAGVTAIFLCGALMLFWAATAARLDPGQIEPSMVRVKPIQAIRLEIMFGLLGLGLIVALRCLGHYRERIPPMTALRQLFTVCTYGTVASLLLLQSQSVVVRASWLPLVWLLLPPALMAVRAVLIPVLNRGGSWEQRALMVSKDSGFDRVHQAVRSNAATGQRIVGRVELDVLIERAALRRGRDEEESTARPLRALLDEYGADEFIVVLDDKTIDSHSEVLRELAYEAVPFSVVPGFDGLPVHGCETRYFMSHPVMLLTFRDNLASPVRRFLKAAFDIGFAAGAIFFTVPMFLLITVLVSLDGGPALFRHMRIGKDGRPFPCLKFRTMVVNGDEVLAKTLAEDRHAAAEWALNRKLTKDPRVTRIGRFLRLTSLDEIPQLFNVLRGEMSLVGPRPIVKAEVVRYGRDIAFYYRVKPGVTGLWQVNGRSNTSYHRRVALDVWYVQNWSLWHDVAILFKTLPALLKREGAV